MARVQSPFAAGERAIRRLERKEQRLERDIQRKEARAYDERLRQAGVERRRQEEIRRKAKIAEEDRKMKQDLIQSIARGKGVGMFGAKVPRINKFILHAPEMEKDPATGKMVKASEIQGDMRIDPGHIERLRTLAQLTRDDQAARALALHRTGKLPPKAEKTLADLASDDFPGRSRQEHARLAMAAPIFGGAPEAEVGPVEAGGVPIEPQPSPAPQRFPTGPGDIDLTQLLQQGILGPSPQPEQFVPGFEQGFAGPPEPAAPLENLHELIQAGVLTGRPTRGTTNKLQENITAMEEALKRPLTDEEILRMGKAVDTKENPFEKLGIDIVRDRLGLGTDTATAAPAAPTPKAPATPKKPAKPAAPREATKTELSAARRNFLEDNPGRTIQSIASKGGQIVIVDDLGQPWFSPVEG